MAVKRWISAGLSDAPRDMVARSTSGEGWFWIAYPKSSTTWGLQLIRADMSEEPLPDRSYESLEAAGHAAATIDLIRG